jgi:integrase
VLYRVALGRSLPRGESSGLRWRYVDLDAGTLRVASSLQIIDGKRVLVQPKTKQSQRMLPLPPSMAATLRQHRALQLQDKMLAGTRWQEFDLVFATSIGTPITESNLVRAFHKLLTRAGLPRMRFHDLRHSCATLLAAQGVAARVAMEILGHANINTTLNIYTHVLDESKRQAMAAMDSMFEKADEA